MRARDITNQRFGRLLALSRNPNRRVGQGTLWLCACDCGNTASVETSHLTNGHTASCGCLGSRRSLGQRNRLQKLKHGHLVGLSGAPERHGAREYRSWQNAKARCLNVGATGYPRYGGRGITMDPRWVNDFAAFLADMGPCPPGNTIERCDNNGPYGPGNCRWATPREQQQNRGCTITLEGGVTLAEFARAHGVTYSTAYGRIVKRGQQPSDALANLSPSA